MKLKKYHILPVLMACIVLLLCVVLIILPIDQILITHRVVNGVESLEYVSKAEGIFKILTSSLGASCVWIFLKSRLEKNCKAEPDMISYRLRSFGIDIIFFIANLTFPIICIINIFLWIREL